MKNLWNNFKTFVALRIFSSEGRINRMQYLKYRIVLFGIGLGLIVIIAIVSNLVRLIDDFAGSLVAAILLFAMAFPIFLGDLLLGIRRCHDLNRTGWLFAIMLIPYVNIVLTVYLMCWRGTDGANDYGEDPALDLPEIPKVSLIKKAS